MQPATLEALADLVLKEFPDALSEQELFIQICKMLYVPEKTDTQARLLAILELVAPSQLWLELVAPPVFLSRSLARGCRQRNSRLRKLVSRRRTVCPVLRSQTGDGMSRIPLPILKSMTWCCAALSARAPGRAQDGLGRAGSESREKVLLGSMDIICKLVCRRCRHGHAC